MSTITITAKLEEVEKIGDLFQINRDYFPNDQLVEHDGDTYTFEVVGPRADYLVEMLKIAPDMRGFEAFEAWIKDNGSQYPLEFRTTAQLGDEAAILECLPVR